MFALGDAMCLDYASRPDAFASLYGKLLDGYLLDAVERLDGARVTTAQIEAFVDQLNRANRSRRPSPSLGEDVRIHGVRVVGSGLELEDELVQLCAFTSDEQQPCTHVARPSRRR